MYNDLGGSLTTENTDPNLHWDGTRWLRWNGSEWTDAETGASLVAPVETEQPAIEEIPAPTASQDAPTAQAAPEPKTYGRADVDAAAERMGYKLGSKREVKKLIEHLWDTEQVEFLASGTYGGGSGLLALTNSRLIFLRDGWTSKVVEDFPLDKISSVQWKSGMLLGSVLIFVSGNKSEIGSVQKEAGKALTDSVRAKISNLASTGAAEVAAPAAPSADAADPMAQIKQLGELRDAGLLTDDEFAAKKAEILSRI